MSMSGLDVGHNDWLKSCAMEVKEEPVNASPAAGNALSHARDCHTARGDVTDTAPDAQNLLGLTA